MESLPDLNLSASGDENNKTILLDTTASSEKANNDDSSVEIEREGTSQPSTGSLRTLDVNDLNHEELLNRLNNLNSESGDQLSSKNDEESKEPKLDKDDPFVSDLLNEDDNNLLAIQPAKPLTKSNTPKKADDLDEEVSVALRSAALLLCVTRSILTRCSLSLLPTRTSKRRFLSASSV